MTLAGTPFTFGIEEEFFLVHPESRNACIRVPERLFRRARERLGAHVSREVFQSQIELSSPILGSPAQARAVMSELRRELATVAAAFDLKLLAAGTHPLAAWNDQLISDSPRHGRLVEDFQIVGRRNLFCGLHVHVAIPAGVDRIDVMNRVMRWLPLFLGLSTSSPFWNRQRTGLLSYRQAAYDEWPRSGIPDFLADEAEYERFTALLRHSGVMKDPSFLWWAIRPSARFPTLELRIADACPRLADALALAALFRCLIAALVEQPDLGRQRTAMSRFLIDENRWRAKRDGTAAELLDPVTGARHSFDESLREALGCAAGAAAFFGCEHELAHLASLGRAGTSAHRQLAIYHEQRQAGASRLKALRRVVDQLIDATHAATET